MLIRPKSASRTRTVHVDSKISQSSIDDLSCDDINMKYDSTSAFHKEDIEQSNTSLRFGTKHEISIENANLQKRSISSQDHIGTVNGIYKH